MLMAIFLVAKNIALLVGLGVALRMKRTRSEAYVAVGTRDADGGRADPSSRIGVIAMRDEELSRHESRERCARLEPRRVP